MTTIDKRHIADLAIEDVYISLSCLSPSPCSHSVVHLTLLLTCRLFSRQSLSIHVGVCVPLCALCCYFFFASKRVPAQMKVWRCCVRTPGYICLSVWALRTTSLPPPSVCLSLPLIWCLSLLQSSPQNRPLIIVWCESGSAVRSYKQRLDVFLADSEREAGAPLEGWGRQITEARPGSRPLQPAVKQQALPLVHSAPSCGSPVWSGSVWLGLIWAGLDREAVAWPWDTLQ